MKPTKSLCDLSLFSSNLIVYGEHFFQSFKGFGNECFIEKYALYQNTDLRLKPSKFKDGIILVPELAYEFNYQQ